MKTLWRGSYVLFHLLAAGYALLLVSGALLHAEPRIPEITELERRVSSLESLQLDHRLTVIETLLQDLQSGNLWSRFTMGGTGLLIAERVVSALRRGGKA